MSTTPKEKTVALGPKPKRTEETRRALAAVTPAREARAADLWHEHAPDGAEEMLHATEERPEE